MDLFNILVSYVNQLHYLHMVDFTRYIEVQLSVDWMLPLILFPLRQSIQQLVRFVIVWTWCNSLICLCSLNLFSLQYTHQGWMRYDQVKFLADLDHRVRLISTRLVSPVSHYQSHTIWPILHKIYKYIVFLLDVSNDFQRQEKIMGFKTMLSRHQLLC